MRNGGAAFALLALPVAGACGAVGPAATAPGPEAAGPPATDVFLLPLAERGGRVVVGRPSNLTARGGYDNQPAFLPDGEALLYTSIRDDGQADTWRASPAGGAPRRVTATAESEYSPTPIPGTDHFSVVRVEADSAQRLWRFDASGGSPALLLPDVAPVGYHAWANERLVALFVLGEPPTLWLADVVTGEAERVAADIGRSLQRIPGREAVSFTVRDARDDARWFAELDARSRAVRRIAPLRAGEGDHAWTPSGVLLTTWGGGLWAWPPDGSGWTAVANLAAMGIARATRLAVSPAGDRLAVVGEAVDP
jgi:hypothetical protein